MSTLRYENIIRQGERSIEQVLFGYDNLNMMQNVLDLFDGVTRPGFGSAGIYLESSLGHNSLGGDISFFVKRERFYQQGIALAASAFFPEVLLVEPIWRKVLTLLDLWTQCEPFRTILLQHVFFEFDLFASECDGIPTPGIFFSCWAHDDCIQVIDFLLDSIEIDQQEEDRQIRKKVIKEFLGNSHMIQVGVMLSRLGSPIRFVAIDVPSAQRTSALKNLGLFSCCNENQELWRRLDDFQDSISGIGLDLLPELGPRVGLEFDFSSLDLVSVARRTDLFRRLFNLLIEVGVCDTLKAEAALGFICSYEYKVDHDISPFLIHNDINHIKIDFQKDRNANAKVYLRCGIKEMV